VARLAGWGDGRSRLSRSERYAAAVWDLDELLEQLVAGTTLDLQPQPEGVVLYKLSDGRTVQVYESFAALQHYCYLVASVVGLVCIKIFGYTDRKAEQLAIDTGLRSS
jgi:phytoene synthase